MASGVFHAAAKTERSSGLTPQALCGASLDATQRESLRLRFHALSDWQGVGPVKTMALLLSFSAVRRIWQGVVLCVCWHILGRQDPVLTKAKPRPRLVSPVAGSKVASCQRMPLLA
jgi:hypothetical protein